jgi:hypothetical protein
MKWFCEREWGKNKYKTTINQFLQCRPLTQGQLQRSRQDVGPVRRHDPHKRHLEWYIWWW